MEYAVNKLLHALIMRTLPVDTIAVLATAKLVVILASFRQQAVIDGGLVYRLEQTVTLQTPLQGLKLTKQVKMAQYF